MPPPAEPSRSYPRPAPPGPDAGCSTNAAARYRTPTGEPCPRAVRLDGTVEGSGECYCCGYCLALETAAWPRS